jgi:hypothetical protein
MPVKKGLTMQKVKQLPSLEFHVVAVTALTIFLSFTVLPREKHSSHASSVFQKRCQDEMK